MKETKWITVREFADRVGLASSSIRNQLRNGKIKEAKLETTPVGDVWLLPESLVDTFAVRGRGRPPKPIEAEVRSTNGQSQPTKTRAKSVAQAKPTRSGKK